MKPFKMKSSVAAVTAILIAGCAPAPVNQEEMARAVEGYIEDVNKLFVVDCLLPGQLRKLGGQVTYLSARRAVRTTAADCEFRGGEYVAYDRANYATALKVWQPKAEEGDATAQLYVGEIYEKGLGQPVDYAMAAKWYRKAAEQGNAQAQINLGALYEKGLGVSKDSGAASNWYRKASGLEAAELQFAAAPSKISDAERQELQSLRQSAQSSKEETAALREELKAAERSRQESERLRSQLQAAEERAAAAERKAAAGGAPSDGDRKAAESSRREAEALRTRLQEAERRADAAEQRAAQGESQETERLRSQLAEAERRADAAEKRAGEGGQQASAAKQASREAEALRAKLKQAESRADAAERRAAQGGAENQAMEALRTELRKTQQKMLDNQEALRASQDELSGLREQLSQQKAASPAAADDPKLRELETKLQAKEASLKSQQSKINEMASSFEKERKKYKQELAQAKQAGTSKATAAQPAGAGGDAANDIENSLHGKMEEYRKGSAELTAMLTQGGAENRGQIDQRKAQLQTQAREISSLKEKLERETAKAKERSAMQKEQLAQAGPRIDILDPEVTLTRGARTIQLDASAKELVGRVQSPSELLSLLVNGQSMTPGSDGVFRYPLDAKSATTSLKIIATDKQKRKTDLDLSVMTGAAPAAAPVSTANLGHTDKPGDLALGKFYALIIGNNQYSAYPALQTAANDAQSLDVVLRERYGFSTKLLINANRHQMMTALNEMHKRLKPEDSLLIYYAGHGEIDKGTQAAYWLPTDAEVGNPANWISSQSITEFLSIMPARHIMVIADSCYSGALTGSAVAKLPDGMDESKRAKWLKVMATRKARTVLTSGGVQPVLDQGGGGHSVFANAFLGVLRSNNKILEDYDVFRAVAGQVQTTASKAGFEQNPQYAPLQHAGHEGSPFFFVPEKV